MQGHACSDRAVRDNTTAATTRKLLMICVLLSLQVLSSFPLRFMRSNQVLADATVCPRNTRAKQLFWRLNLSLSVLRQDRKVLQARCCMSHNPHRLADCPALSSNHSQSKKTSLIDEWPSFQKKQFYTILAYFSPSSKPSSTRSLGLWLILVEVELFPNLVIKRSSEGALDMLGIWATFCTWKWSAWWASLHSSSRKVRAPQLCSCAAMPHARYASGQMAKKSLSRARVGQKAANLRRRGKSMQQTSVSRRIL